MFRNIYKMRESERFIYRPEFSTYSAGCSEIVPNNQSTSIFPSTIEMEMIQNLEGINWSWKNNGKAAMGVSAQNVEQVAPQLVGQGEYKSVNYNGLVGILIEAVKSLKEEIDELKK